MGEEKVIPKQHLLRLLVNAGFLEVLVGGVRVLLPQLLQLVDLLRRDLPRAHLVALARTLHQPRQEAPVHDQRLPLLLIPGKKHHTTQDNFLSVQDNLFWKKMLSLVIL